MAENPPHPDTEITKHFYNILKVYYARTFSIRFSNPIPSPTSGRATQNVIRMPDVSVVTISVIKSFIQPIAAVIKSPTVVKNVGAEATTGFISIPLSVN